MAVIQETRDVKGFQQVWLEGFGDLVIVQGEEEGLTIEAEESLIPRIKTEVADGRLKIGYRFWPLVLMPAQKAARYTVRMRAIEGVQVSGSGTVKAGAVRASGLRLVGDGACDFELEDLRADELVVRVSGAGQFRLTGSIERQDLNVSGSAKYEAFGLECRDARVHISGSAEVDLRATVSLDIHISGAGSVRYTGEPSVEKSITGAGRVEKVQAAA